MSPGSWIAGGPMGQTLGERLAAARRAAFVGREAERALFDEWIRAADPDAAVLYVHGPAGVGKSTLLARFADTAAEAGVPTIRLDIRDLPPVREALSAALAPALGPRGRRPLVLIDTYEMLDDDTDAWVRGHLLPTLPADTRVVLAGQRPPSTAWRTDPGWSALLRAVPLGNLDADECRAFLEARRIDSRTLPDVLSSTHGHPLALTLAAEVIAGGGSAAHLSPDVIATLLDRLLAAVPSAAHRRALEASAQVRALDEALLAAMLDQVDVGETFRWLRGLPFMEMVDAGLAPHDLVRDALDADLRWRDPARQRDLRSRARAHFLAGLDGADRIRQARIVLDLMYLHQDFRLFLGAGAPQVGDGLRLDHLSREDAPAVIAAVRRHEGEESAALAGHWVGARPDAWHVVRGSDGVVHGFLCALPVAADGVPVRNDGVPVGVDAVDDPSRPDAGDPAVAAAVREVAASAPLREPERALLFRFWMSVEGYQSVSPVQSLLAAHLARTLLLTPGLAISLLAVADPDLWADFCRYADHRRIPGADFTVGGWTYAVFGHDWRAVPPAAWLALLAGREVSGATAPTEPDPTLSTRAAVLSRQDFADAVRRALRDLTRPDRLRGSPLLGTWVVLARTGLQSPVRERVAALQDVLREAVAGLRGNPADERLYRVLHRAYLAPAPSLERAAEALGLPSSTFRRYLAAGVARVVEILWEREVVPDGRQ